MYQIRFYRDRREHEPVREFLIDLRSKKDKTSRILYRLVTAHIKALTLSGLRTGMPYIRRIDKEIWELRPQRYRIFFFAFHQDSFVLLHHYYKKTEKTPTAEIERAHREMENYLAEEE